MKNNFDESSDEGAVRRRRERCMELSAMFKEQKSGSPSILNSILAKFSLQEGVTHRRAKEYFNLLVSAKLIVWKYGRKRWEYNKDAEWELYRIEI